MANDCHWRAFMVRFNRVSIIVHFAGKVVANGALLWAANRFFPEYIRIQQDAKIILLAALVLAALNMFLRPILRLVTTPIRWLTLGLFNIVIHLFILWVAEALLGSVTVVGAIPFILFAFVIAIVNTII